MRSLIRSAVAGMGAILCALGLPACESDPQSAQETETTQQKQVTCHKYQDYQGTECAICFRWHWERDQYGSWKELDSYTESCGN